MRLWAMPEPRCPSPEARRPTGEPRTGWRNPRCTAVFLRENLYFETKHLFLCFCVHNASLLVENGPKVGRHVSSRVSPAL